MQLHNYKELIAHKAYTSFAIAFHATTWYELRDRDGKCNQAEMARDKCWNGKR